VFTARYCLIPYIKQIVFRLEKFNVDRSNLMETKQNSYLTKSKLNALGNLQITLSHDSPCCFFSCGNNSRFQNQIPVACSVLPCDVMFRNDSKPPITVLFNSRPFLSCVRLKYIAVLSCTRKVSRCRPSCTEAGNPDRTFTVVDDVIKLHACPCSAEYKWHFSCVPIIQVTCFTVVNRLWVKIPCTSLT
jgi:hypothetical protein